MIPQIHTPTFDKSLDAIYGSEASEAQCIRYEKLIEKFVQKFNDNEISLFSTSGRSEIIGNHTDHNYGCVLAAGINLDTIAVVSKNAHMQVHFSSEGFSVDTLVDLNKLEVMDKETGTTASLIRGIAARMNMLGYKVGGFNAVVTSDVLRGSGLSSSAAIEVLICTILSNLYNDGKVDMVEAAKISQWSENNYFGKPCGLMDQTACALGNLVHIDFANPKVPVINSIRYDFKANGYAILITDVRADHADLTDEYAAITDEMSEVAAFFDTFKLRQADETKFYEHIGALRGKVSERAIMRAMHFFGENKRVNAAVEAIKNNDLKSFFAAIIESGESSWKLLQNIYATGSTSQPLALALALSEKMLKGKGAWRVHGGGFGGTVLAFVPLDEKDNYMQKMNNVFGSNACTELSIRPCGSVKVNF